MFGNSRPLCLLAQIKTGFTTPVTCSTYNDAASMAALYYEQILAQSRGGKRQGRQSHDVITVSSQQPRGQNAAQTPTLLMIYSLTISTKCRLLFALFKRDYDIAQRRITITVPRNHYKQTTFDRNGRR